MADVLWFETYRRSKRRKGKPTFFSRAELNSLLSMYSRRVASGDWKDYAIDHHTDAAVFSVFRHTHERPPLYSIAKRTGPGGNKSTEYLVFSGLQRLARAHNLGEALKVVEKKLHALS